MKNALIIVTRVPILGKTKTRLEEILTKKQCVEIHFCFLKDIFKTFEQLKNQMDIYLAYTPKESFKVIEDFIPNYIKTFPQRGETLGDRMSNAINDLLDMQYEKVVLIGSDIPQISKKDITLAFKNLKDSDLVLAPTYDGGYYLVGMKEKIPMIFKGNLSWGYSSVFESTLKICCDNNINFSITNKLLDIDTKEDLLSLYKDIKDKKIENKPIKTYEFIKKLNIENIYVRNDND